MKKPAYSKTFQLTPAQSAGSGAWVFIGRWEPAQNLAQGLRVLCIPPDDDPLKADWSILRGVSAIVWLYSSIDVAGLAVVMRAAGALDLAFFEMASGRFVWLALTLQSEKLLTEFDAEAA